MGQGDELRRVATTRRTWASSLPLVVQVPLILILADLLAYWSHRIFHGRLLWRFHAIHHSSTNVDWLSSVRLHPVNDAVSRIVQVGLFPFIDLAFGTFYMPPGRKPQRFGITNDDVPSGLVAQLVYPFRRK